MYASTPTTEARSDVTGKWRRYEGYVLIERVSRFRRPAADSGTFRPVNVMLGDNIGRPISNDWLRALMIDKSSRCDTSELPIDACVGPGKPGTEIQISMVRCGIAGHAPRSLNPGRT